MKPLGQFFLFGIAAAFILGATFIKANTSPLVVILLGVAVTLASTFIFLYRPKRKRLLEARTAANGLVPGTAPWAEALYKHGFISKTELDGFLAELKQQGELK